MKNKLIIIPVLIAILVATISLTGCTINPSVDKYKVGTNGLVIEFSKSNPVSIYEREEFGTALFIKNIGSYDVSDYNPAKLKILYDNYRISSKQSSGDVEISDIALYGKSQYYPIGEEGPVEFYFESNSLTELRESAKTTISYNLCYPYATEFTTMTCIDTKSASKADTTVACTSEVYNGGGGQGAPIVITKIEPEIMLQENYIRPQYKIYIENLGGGYVSNKKTCEAADINLFSDTYNEFSGRVTVYAELSGEKLDCGPDKTGTLRLVDSSSYITCYLSKTANSNKYSRTKKNYLSPLTIKIEYTYVVLEKQEIEIKRNDLIQQDVTQGLCLSYQVEYNNKCIDKCKYCAENPSDIMCQQGKPYPGFVFREGFSCACSLAQCNIKESKGSCIKGYCSGSQYCCSTLECDQWEVEYDGQCIDRCEYCSEINSSDMQICDQGFNFAGFQCEPMLKQECDNLAQRDACILRYCGTPDAANGGKVGDQNVRYCANLKKASCPPANNPRLTEVSPSGECMNLCEYCALYGTAQNDARCTYSNNAQQRSIPSTFRCSCTQHDLDTNLYDFIPTDSFCGQGSGLYCCNMIRGS